VFPGAERIVDILTAWALQWFGFLSTGLGLGLSGLLGVVVVDAGLGREPGHGLWRRECRSEKPFGWHSGRELGRCCWEAFQCSRCILVAEF
jgi:hypothetical protein